MKRILRAALAAAAAASMAAAAQAALALAAGPFNQGAHGLVPPGRVEGVPVPLTPIRYGPGPSQLIRLARPAGAAPVPLVVVLRIPGWPEQAGTYDMRRLPTALFEAGYAYAAPHYDSGRDRDPQRWADELARALEHLLEHAADHGIDPRRVAIVGHGAGGWLAALAGTDPERRLGPRGRAGLRAVAVVNGELLDLPGWTAAASDHARGRIHRRFGDDPALLRQLSPAAHVARPNAPFFLFQAVARPAVLPEAGQAMAEALRAQGSDARFAALPEWRQGVFHSQYGHPDSAGWQDLAALLEAAFADRPAG